MLYPFILPDHYRKSGKDGADLTKTNLKTGHFGAEPWTVEMRTEIEARGKIHAYEHYGLTELMGPGVSFTCEHYNIHINEDHVFLKSSTPEPSNR